MNATLTPDGVTVNAHDLTNAFGPIDGSGVTKNVNPVCFGIKTREDAKEKEKLHL
jgi:hypothetical protein